MKDFHGVNLLLRQALSVPVEGRLYKLLASIGRVGSNCRACVCVCVCVCDSVANDASLTMA